MIDKCIKCGCKKKDEKSIVCFKCINFLRYRKGRKYDKNKIINQMMDWSKIKECFILKDFCSFYDYNIKSMYVIICKDQNLKSYYKTLKRASTDSEYVDNRKNNKGRPEEIYPKKILGYTLYSIRSLSEILGLTKCKLYNDRNLGRLKYKEIDGVKFHTAKNVKDYINKYYPDK